MAEHPYKSAPERNFWRRSVASVSPAEVDPVGEFKLKIGSRMKVATAGSCFAQHVTRYLQEFGFNYFVTESGHPALPPEILAANNYGAFPARYGNIYTALQLLQLMQRAFGELSPVDDCWQQADDIFVDPFRPSVQPGGYISELEMRQDRRQHLAAVRQMFEDLDIFIFTLGLTECWVSAVDGAVYPLCPGVEAGEFDPERYMFWNASVDDVVAEMSSFLKMLERVNPKAQVVLTVSPVPLVATARADQHVLAATTYSKSVLRVAAEMLCARFGQVHYFPSYEIITGAFSRGAYFGEDLRSISEQGVRHVMNLFMKHATTQDMPASPMWASGRALEADESTRILAKAEQFIEVECDEIALDRD
jgi:hypothetical protein